jgi:DnaJ-class molecular chaperone
MSLYNYSVAVISLAVLFNLIQPAWADGSSNEKQREADKRRKAFEESNAGKKYPPSFKTDASDYHNGKDRAVGYEKPMRDWSKPVPEEKDIKCPKCNGTGITKEMVGNRDPVLEVKICKRCAGKGTVGRTKN